MTERHHGSVAEFDEAVGLGEIVSDSLRYGFHCTQIADGSRTIPAGTPVSFVMRAGRHGQWEAADVRPTA